MFDKRNLEEKQKEIKEKEKRVYQEAAECFQKAIELHPYLRETYDKLKIEGRIKEN